MHTMKITDTIKYVGVNDHQVDLFEGQYKVPNGMSYNSYVILDEKVAVMDTVDANFTHEWLDNIQQVLDDRAGSRCQCCKLSQGLSGYHRCFQCKSL